MLHIFHHFESMCIGMFEFIYGQHIHIYISATAGPRSNTVHFKPLHPRTTFFQCCEMSKMKGRKTKTPYGLNPPTRKLTFFWYPSGSVHFLKESCNQNRNVWCVQPHTFPPPKTLRKKNNNRFSSTKQKKLFFFSTFIIYIHRQNQPTKPVARLEIRL